MKSFDEYQKVARSSAIYPMSMPVIYPALGLAGETGEVLDKIKKILLQNHKKAFLSMILWKNILKWLIKLRIVQKSLIVKQ